MAAVVGKTDVELTKKTTDVEVDENNWSKLMYYINCIATVLRMDDDDDITRLRRFKQFRGLTDEDKDKILIFCTLLAPEILENKCIFQDDSMCHKYLNEFYDLNVASTKLVITENVLIGGTQKAVKKIMCYTKSWLKDNYTDPYNAIIAARKAERAASRRMPIQRGGATGKSHASSSGQIRSQADAKRSHKDCVIQ